LREALSILKAYDGLLKEQQIKDRLFSAIVGALKAIAQKFFASKQSAPATWLRELRPTDPPGVVAVQLQNWLPAFEQARGERQNWMGAGED